MNLVELTGRLTRDPEVRYSNELPIANWTLAVDRRGKDAGTDFIRIKAFGKAASAVESYLKKGRLIEVTGRIQTGSYMKDGKNIATCDIICEDWRFLGSAPKEDANMKEESYETKDSFAELSDEDIPF